MKTLFKKKGKKSLKTGVQEMQAGEALAIGMSKLIIERLHEDAVIPTYATEGDSGMDVYATADMVLMPGFNDIIKIGLKMEIPTHPLHSLGYRWECQVRPRSGMSAATLLRISNAPGTIDNFFRGEIGIVVNNTADKTHYLQGVDYVIDLKGNKVPLAEANVQAENVPQNSYLIRKGDKIAQLVFTEVIRPLEIIEGTVTNENSRGGGFGHSDDIPAVEAEVVENTPAEIDDTI